MTNWFNQTVRPGAAGFPTGQNGAVDWWIGSTGPVNVAAKNASSTDAVINYTERDGGSFSDTISANSTYEVPSLDIVRFNVTGNGAVVALWMGWPERKPPTSLSIVGTISATATVTGTVSTSIDAQTVGVAPATTFAGAAIDPRIATLQTDNIGLAKAAQLPASLDTGALKVAVEKPLTGAGSVQVHDTGA